MSKSKSGNGKKPPPRRRDMVPAMGDGTAAAETPGLGASLEEAVGRPITALQGMRDQLNGVPARMSVPEPDAPEQKRYVAPLYQGQVEMSFRMESGLDQAQEVVARTGVHPGELSLGRRYLSILGEGKRVAVLGQNLVADARLVEGARFSFYYGKLMTVYQRRLNEGTQQEKIEAVRAFANLDKVRFQLLVQSQQSRKATEAGKTEMKQSIAEQKDEAAFVDVLKKMEMGQQPDLASIEAAHRHADRLQAQYGLPLDRRSQGRQSG